MKSERTCAVAGCEKHTRTGKADLCAMHYHRMYRHGNVDASAHTTDVTASLGRRYKATYASKHPLATKNGMVYEHRAVLFDHIGPGPHPCHWCRTPVDWLPKGTPGELQVDHLNGDGADNDPDNLVPSCRTCNTTRGAQTRADALRAAGWWSNHDTLAALSSYERRPRVA